ncbi:MAG: methylcrotonoyl-CoA carboxylase, partial [Bdellovibrio sp.]|nr:methylcrotonoyl-CoA carboxylase [Bdellovibrio sp.]
MILETQIDSNSDEFKKNKSALLEHVNEWLRRVEIVKAGGGAEAMKKHKSRGKLTARERIEGLLDPGTAFLEFSTLAAWDMYEGQAPGAGIVTGIGV